MNYLSKPCYSFSVLMKIEFSSKNILDAICELLSGCQVSFSWSKNYTKKKKKIIQQSERKCGKNEQKNWIIQFFSPFILQKCGFRILESFIPFFQVAKNDNPNSAKLTCAMWNDSLHFYSSRKKNHNSAENFGRRTWNLF